jgi:hypothetical protein
VSREWIEIASSATVLLIASFFFFGTDLGRRYRVGLRASIAGPRNAVAIATAAFVGALSITGLAHYVRFGFSLEPVRVGSALVLPIGVAVITYFVFRR